jgi:large subunit ribosomal protein L2
MRLLKSKKPTTPSQRQELLLNLTNLEKVKPLKHRTCFIKNNAGRNNKGRITSFNRGGGHKKKYRILSSHHYSILSGIVESIEYDPYRSANIARIFSEETKEKFKISHFYILAPEGLKKGHFISSQLMSKDFSYKIGNRFYLKDLPLGVFVHDIKVPQKKGSIARSAGCGAQIISKDKNYCRLRLNSGEYRLFSLTTEVTLGIVSNSSHKLINLGKAGRSRWLNKRPSVRGVAMNPVDHPHGGGEGKTSGGRPSVTPWGKITRGQPTKKKKISKI